MAAFANNARSRLHPSTLARPHPSRSPDTAGPAAERKFGFPEGSCNYRDLAAGPKPPECGCRRFWLRARVEMPGRSEAGQELEPWCMCGHHACFHDRTEQTKYLAHDAPASFKSKGSVVPHQDESTPFAALSDARSPAVLQGWLNSSVLASLNSAKSTNAPADKTAEQGVTPEQQGVQDVPSFNLTSAELYGFHDVKTSVGLGLDLYRNVYMPRLASQSPTVADGASVNGEFQIPSTRQASTEDNASPDSAFLRHIQAGRRMLGPSNSTAQSRLGLGLCTTIEETESTAPKPLIMTSSESQYTRNLVQEASDVVDVLEKTTTLFSRQSHEDIGHSTIETSIETLHSVLQSLPHALNKLVPLINSLQSHMSRNPDVSIHESIQSLSKRMDEFENTSFSHLIPDQIQEHMQHFDMRLLEVETRSEEHQRLISGFRHDESSSDSRSRAKATAKADGSFTSVQSGLDLTLVTSDVSNAAVLGRMETDEHFRAVEERLDVLEKTQMPSPSMPWNVEIVFLPWSANLHGIWYADDALTKPGSTRGQVDTASGRCSRSSMSMSESYLTEATQQNWKSGEDERLFARACGITGIIYQRLKSRGFVRKVRLTSAGARNITLAVYKSFGDLLDMFTQPTNTESIEEDDKRHLHGLRAPFIPLRKVHKSSRLRFMTDDELATPALWTAEFLSSGVMMRAAAGERRLFITTSQGYCQDSNSSWTWAKLRELSRVHDPDSQERMDTEDVPEADAYEPCWRHHTLLDATSSVHSSFQSRVSDSVRYLTAQTTKDEENSGDELTSPFARQPITPVSEFPATQTSPNMHRRTRTISVPVSEPILRGKSTADSLPHPPGSWTSQQSKHCVHSFEQAANPGLIAALPTFVPSSSKAPNSSLRIKKRRRITLSKSTSSRADESQSSGHENVESLHPEADPVQVLEHLQSVIPIGGTMKSLGQFEPRAHYTRRASLSLEGSRGSQSTGRVLAGPDSKRGITPNAYLTPFSGIVAGPDHDDNEYKPSESGSDDWNGVDEEQEAFFAKAEDQEMKDDDHESDSIDSEFTSDAESNDEIYDDYMDDDSDQRVKQTASEDELC